MTREQCQAARALLGWTSEELAKAAGIGVATVWRFESGESVRAASTKAMKDALEIGGIEFIERNGGGEGVRLNS